MWTSTFLFFFFLIVAVQSVQFLWFSHITCAEIFAGKLFPVEKNLKDAIEKCVNNPHCIGINKTSDTTFQLLDMLYGFTLTSKPTNYYIFDRNNGTSLPSAPSKLDATILFSIYISGECPAGYMLGNSFCTSVVPESMCNKYPSYMNATWTYTIVTGGAVQGNCTVVPKSAVIKTWS